MSFEIDLFDKLPDCDIQAIEDYIAMFGLRNDDEGDRTLKRNTFAPLSYRLRYWNKNKTRLYRLLDNQFIYSKEIVFQESTNDKMDELDHLLYHSTFIIALREKIMDNNINNTIFTEKHNENTDNWSTDCYRLKKLLWSYEDIYFNRLSQNTFYIKVKDNKPIKFQHGCKPIKALAKIANQLDLNMEFEEFRLEHSRILNTATVKGTLCLSIHPLDYITMSDNCCDWDSCMSWMNGGCYHGGTIEMMNSSCVIVAYVKASDDMCLGNGFYWSNKKWRTLVIVDDKFAVPIKAYPYSHIGLDDMILETIRELASNNLDLIYDAGISKYDEDMTIPFKTGAKRIWFQTNTMYNDFGRGQENHMLIHSENAAELPDNKAIDYNYCGPRNCMWCGEINNFFSTGDVFCSDCVFEDRLIGSCAECGYTIYDGESYYSLSSGEIVCEDCCSYISECSFCGEWAFNSDLAPVLISYKGYPISRNKCQALTDKHKKTLNACCLNCLNQLHWINSTKSDSLLEFGPNDDYVIFDLEQLDTVAAKEKFNPDGVRCVFRGYGYLNPSIIADQVITTKNCLTNKTDLYVGWDEWEKLTDTIKQDVVLNSISQFQQRRYP